MSNYGIQSTGFIRKTIAEILADLQNRFKQPFGPNVIQTAQSPLGQIEGIVADFTSVIWQLAEDIYQQNDPDTAEGINLDRLGRIRNLVRGGLSDDQFRQVITLRGSTHLDAEDATNALLALEGVEYAQVWTNESGEFVDANLPQGYVSVAVIGGADEEVAAIVRQYVLPGVSLFGNSRVSATINGVCRSVSIIRPIVIPVTLEIEIKTTRTLQGCPPPSTLTIKQQLVSDWLLIRQNGMDITAFTVRSIIERTFSNLEVTSIKAARDGGSLQPYATISFLEIASLEEDDITVELIT